MKTERIPTRSSTWSWGLLICLLLTATVSYGQTKTRTIEKTYDANGQSTMAIEHHRGDLVVKRSTDDKCHIRLDVEVKGSDPAEIEHLFEVIELEERSGGSEVKTVTGIQQWNRSNGRTKVKLRDGTVLRSLESIDIEMTVWLPTMRSIKLSNKYHNIVAREAIPCQAVISLYSGRLETKDIQGDLELKMKYSSGQVGNFAQGTFEFYETDIELGNGGDLEIASKYSEVALGTVNSISIQSYEDEYEIKAIPGKVSIRDKYSEFDLTEIGPATFELYESDVKFTQGGEIMMSSKYSELDAIQVTSLAVESGYEDKVSLREVSTIDIANDKYSEYDIDQLSTRFKIKGYETNVDIGSVASSLQEIWIDSKYDKMRFGFPAGLKYDLDAELKYGDIDYHEGITVQLEKQKTGDETAIKWTQSGATAKVYVRAYNTDIELK